MAKLQARSPSLQVLELVNKRHGHPTPEGIWPGEKPSLGPQARLRNTPQAPKGQGHRSAVGTHLGPQGTGPQGHSHCPNTSFHWKGLHGPRSLQVCALSAGPVWGAVPTEPVALAIVR